MVKKPSTKDIALPRYSLGKLADEYFTYLFPGAQKLREPKIQAILLCPKQQNIPYYYIIDS